METGTFPDKALADYINDKFIPIKYESGMDAEQFKRFNVMGIPAFVVLDAEGNELSRFIGFQAPEQLMDELDKIRAGSG